MNLLFFFKKSTVKKMYLFLIYFNLILFGKPLFAQTQSTTLTVMNYNVGNYGALATINCPLLNLTTKNAYLRTIMQYVSPDIVALTKIDNLLPAFSTTKVVDSIFNKNCFGCYDHGGFTNISGYSKVNMLYYKTSNVGFKSTTTIYSGDNNISDINLHKLYYKSPTLSTLHDTIFINVIVAHLDSGSGSSSMGNRAVEINGAMSWLNSHVTSPGNYIFMGDLNTQKSNENCFQYLVNSSNPNTKFFDPPNQLGNWSNSPNLYNKYLTHSTRTNDPGDCNATGGMNNRFDHILCTQSIMAGTNSVTYIPTSYKVIGQDGLHTNNALIDSPTNVSAPSPVINALYYMSEHLPEIIRLQINYNLSVDLNGMGENNFIITPNPSSSGIFQVLATNERLANIEVYNLLSQNVLTSKADSQNTTIDLSKQTKGVYFVKLTDIYKRFVVKKIVIQ
jgi:hypothetical protein